MKRDRGWCGHQNLEDVFMHEKRDKVLTEDFDTSVGITEWDIIIHRSQLMLLVWTFSITFSYILHFEKINKEGCY